MNEDLPKELWLTLAERARLAEIRRTFDKSIFMPSKEAHVLILRVLDDAGEPLAKKQILERTGIKPYEWNLRIKELLVEGKVCRKGTRLDTRYALADH